jgi:hypothetical protein
LLAFVFGSFFCLLATVNHTFFPTRRKKKEYDVIEVCVCVVRVCVVRVCWNPVVDSMRAFCVGV